MKKAAFAFCLTLIAFATLPFSVWAWSGKVIGVADGDTITVLHGKQQEKIRLYGIDCPEKRQAFGNEGRRFTSHLVLGKTVEVHRVTCDRYGSTVAIL
ncbi:MAG: thermonuclease family protein [Syntrophobacteria bacterium]